MTGGRRAAVAIAAAAVLLWIAAVPSPALGLAGPRQATIEWRACRPFSAQALEFMVDPNQRADFKRLWSRTRCGELRVPLDYAKPNGRQITIAVTRLEAAERRRRLGSLALNPGGPGGSGYLLPVRFVLARNPAGRSLHQRFDLIGFDPRGVGSSTKVNCPPPEGGAGLFSSPLTEASARKIYASQVQANRSCARVSPSFLRQLTTANVARDLDRIRVALGEQRISFLGISWGTLLGAAYRSLFPQHTYRMWLDSPSPPRLRLDAFEAARDRAIAADFSRFAAWLAERDRTFGFGASAAAVESALAAMRAQLDASPKTFSDLPNMVVDGSMIAQISAGFSLSWPLAGPLLKAVREAPSGGPAPPEAIAAWGGGPPPKVDHPPTPPKLPEEFNETTNRVMLCNEDRGRRDFASAWAAYQARLRLYPVTGEFSAPTPGCPGWWPPAPALQLRRSAGPLVISAHRYELTSPYEWAKRMQAAVGGSLLTVEDDVHGSTAGMRTDCAPKIAIFFFTGDLDGDHCEGIPVPKVTQAPLPG